MGLWVEFHHVRMLRAFYSGRLTVTVLVPFHGFLCMALLVVVVEGGVGGARAWKENGVGIGNQPAVAFLLSTIFACRFLVVLLVLSVELIPWG